MYDANSGSASTPYKIRAVTFHPTLPHIAAVGDTPTAKIYDIVSGKYIAFIPLPGFGTQVCYSQDGRFLATATTDGDWREGEGNEEASAHQVCLWNAMDGYRLVKKDGYGVSAMRQMVLKERGWKSSKVAEIKEEMEFIKEKFYKLHKGKIISLQFLKPTVEIPYGLDDFNKREEDWQKSKNNVYQEIEVLFSACEGDVLRFWEYNPRFNDKRKTIPCEEYKDYDQGLRYFASLAHMDMIVGYDGVPKRHQSYIDAKVSPDGRILCTLDSKSRTACLVKLAYEKMLAPSIDSKSDGVAYIPRDSERSISFPLMLHRFEQNIQMLCLDFIPDPNPPNRNATAGNSNRVIGSYHIVFGGTYDPEDGHNHGKNKNADTRSMMESLTLEMANKGGDQNLDTLLRSETRPDEQLSPFILETSGVLAGSVRKIRINMSKKIQISSNQETITRVTHATRFDGKINSIRVSPDGRYIATGDEYSEGDERKHVVSSWTQIPAGFSRKTVGQHTGSVTSLNFPGKENLMLLQRKFKLSPNDWALLSCGDATIHLWKNETADIKLVDEDEMEPESKMASKDKEELIPLMTVEHQITGRQKQEKKKIKKEIEALKEKLEEPTEEENSTKVQRETQEKQMAEQWKGFLTHGQVSTMDNEKALRIQEQMYELADKEDQLWIQHLDNGKIAETGLESYARFTAKGNDNEDEKDDDDIIPEETNPVLNDSLKPQNFEKQGTKREQCVTCTLQ
mmetsp:Transcript_11032/g.20286  ORF Transcript_11032/g.20286 Transcript_11032/m.20286 type:complete len:736 (-) Transcript_11032:178-2385(-)